MQSGCGSRSPAEIIAAPGTPDHDRLKVLGLLVNAYEDRRWPIAREPSPPAQPISRPDHRTRRSNALPADRHHSDDRGRADESETRYKLQNMHDAGVAARTPGGASDFRQ
jgi:hypothetical protein